MIRRPRRWPRSSAAGLLAVLVAFLAGAGALLLRPDAAEAAWQRLAQIALPWDVRGGIEHGIYYGWASSERGLLQLAGKVCSPEDPLVTVAIPIEDEALTLGVGEVRTEHADLGLPGRVAALSLVPHETALDRLRTAAIVAHDATRDATQDATHASPTAAVFHHVVARCRSGVETRAGVGIASWMVLPTPPRSDPATDVRVVAARSAPYLGVLAALVVANEGPEPITLARLTYAPDGTATGRVRAAAGSAAQLAGWRWLATGPGNGAVDPAGLTPWHAAYQSPSDPRAMRVRSADALDLSLAPGEVAMIVIDQDSLATTRPPRRVILYPVLSVASGAGIDGGRGSIRDTGSAIGTSRDTGSAVGTGGDIGIASGMGTEANVGTDSIGTPRTVRFVGSPLPAVGWTASEREARTASPPQTDESSDR